MSVPAETAGTAPGAGRLKLIAAAAAGLLMVVGPLVPGTVRIGPVTVDSVMLSVAVLVLASIPYLRSLGRDGWPRVGVEAPMLVFLAWSAVSVVFAANGGSAASTLVRYISYAVVVVVFAAVGRDVRVRRWMLRLFVLSSSVVSALGLFQYLNPEQGIGMQGLDASVATRVAGTFDNPNFFGEFLVMLVPATLALLFLERGGLRWAAGALLGVQGLALLLTYTRGSWLALAAGIVVAAALIDWRIIIPFAAAGAALIAVVPGGVERLKSIGSLEGTGTFRIRLWRIGAAAVASRPLFGFGVGDFYTAYAHTVLTRPDLTMGYLIYGAHNSYLQLSAETGVIGGLAFTWLVAAAVAMGVHYAVRLRSDRMATLENAAYTAALVAFGLNALTSNSFQHPRAGVFFWVLVGLQAACGAAAFGAPEPVRSERVRQAGVLSLSATGRFVLRVAEAVGRAWRGSLLRRVLVAAPLGRGELFARSMVARLLFGGGRDRA